MDERSRRPTPPETGLAIPEPTLQDRLQLTPAQLSIVQERVPQYLRNHHLPFNQQTVKAAQAIIGIDAIERAMLHHGITALQPEHNVRSLIKEGLDLRESVRARAKVALEGMTDVVHLSSSLLIGSYAYDNVTTRAALGQIKQFARTPNISDAERIVETHTFRSHALPQLAQVAIDAVPHEVFPDASLENFSTPDDQAKLVRNMLTSLLFRRDASPVITIEELRQFVERGESIQNLLQGNDIVAYVIDRLPDESRLPKSVYQKYLIDLIVQIQLAFLRLKPLQVDDVSLTHEQIVFERDLFYRQFNNTLLLLHPALEERSIITYPQKAEPGDYSLWRPDLSVVLYGQRIPTLDALFRAERLIGAKGYDTNRFQEARRTWRIYYNMQDRESKRLETLNKEKADLTEKLSGVESGVGTLPSVAFMLTRAWENATYEQIMRALYNFEDNVRRIQSGKEARLDLEKYQSQIVELPKGENDTLPAPSFVQRRIGIAERANRARAETASKNLAEKVFQLAQEDAFLTQELPDGATPQIFLDKSQDEIHNEIDELKQRTEELQTSGAPLPKEAKRYTYRDMMTYIGRYREMLDARMATPRRTRQEQAVRGDSKRRGSLEFLRKRLEEMRKEGNSEEEMQRVFYIHGLQNRIGIMELAREANERLVYSQTPIHVPDPLPAEHMREWIQIAQTETIPLERYTTEELRSLWPPLDNYMRETSSHSGSIVWPKIIPEKDEFKQWISNAIARASQVVEDFKDIERTFDHEYYDARRRVDALSELLKIIDHPLFPIKEGTGLTSSRFWNAFRVRMRLIKSLVMMEQSSDFYNKADADLNDIARQVYIRYLHRRIQQNTEEVKMLQTHPPSEANLLRKMHALNLVKDEVHQENPGEENNK